MASRSKTFTEALSKALDISIRMLPGIMFMTGLIWVAMAFWNFSSIDLGKDGKLDPFSLIWPVVRASVIAIIVTVGSMFLASSVGAMAIAYWAQRKGIDFTEAKIRVDKFDGLLDGGAMSKLFHGTPEKHDDPG